MVFILRALSVSTSGSLIAIWGIDYLSCNVFSLISLILVDLIAPISISFFILVDHIWPTSVPL